MVRDLTHGCRCVRVFFEDTLFLVRGASGLLSRVKEVNTAASAKAHVKI